MTGPGSLMLESRTPDSVKAEMMMDEQKPRVYLLLEGAEDDAIIFDLLQPDATRILCGGKETLLGALKLVAHDSSVPVFGLIDRDLDPLWGRDPYPVGAFVTTAYDLASDVLLATDCLRRVLSAHAPQVVRDIESSGGSPIQDQVYGLALLVASVRLAAIVENLAIKSRSFAFDRFVGREGSASDDDVVRLLVPAASPEQVKSIARHVAGARETIGQAREHCSGHDVVGAAVALLRSGSGANLSKQAIAASIHSHADPETLLGLDCLRSIDTVSLAVTGMTVFRQAA